MVPACGGLGRAESGVPGTWLVLDASEGHDHRVVVERVDVHHDGVVRRGTVGRVWATREPITPDNLKGHARELKRGRGGRQRIVWEGLCRDVFSRRYVDELQVWFPVEFPPTVVTEARVQGVTVLFTGVELFESGDRLEFVAHREEFGGYAREPLSTEFLDARDEEVRRFWEPLG